MNVRLLVGTFRKIDGQVLEDFELIAAGTVTVIPARTGDGGCSLDTGNFIQR